LFDISVSITTSKNLDFLKRQCSYQISVWPVILRSHEIQFDRTMKEANKPIEIQTMFHQLQGTPVPMFLVTSSHRITPLTNPAPADLADGEGSPERDLSFPT
jgi:hypothetical protein